MRTWRWLVVVVVVAAPSQTEAAPAAQGCYNITMGFGRLWTQGDSTRQAFGCAVEPEKGVYMAEQFFQNGRLLWRSDNDLVYVMYYSGWPDWDVYMPTWYPGDPELDTRLIAPWGFIQPKRGFGSVWREHAGVRDRLGWAIEEEQPANGTVQTFERGFMFRTPRFGGQRAGRRLVDGAIVVRAWEYTNVDPKGLQDL